MFLERNSGTSTIDYPMAGSGAIVDALIRGGWVGGRGGVGWVARVGGWVRWGGLPGWTRWGGWPGWMACMAAEKVHQHSCDTCTGWGVRMRDVM